MSNEANEFAVAEITRLSKQVQKLTKLQEATEELFNFDLVQYHLHKEAGDYEHRYKATLDVLAALAELQ